MKQYWLVVGTPRNWQVSFENGNLWGLKEFRELTALWNLLREGDGLLFYVSKPISGVVGCATVLTKFRQTKPLWPEEVRRQTVVWPLRFEFEIEYCLSPDLWTSKAYKDVNLQLITRMVFQCVPSTLVEAIRGRFSLPPSIEEAAEPAATSVNVTSQDITQDHEAIKDQLFKIGQIQGYLAEKEYPIDNNRLDVVWRRVERSVPTYAFEVQVGGDIYHALVKLKRAYELWNSRVFIVGGVRQRSKFEELTAGTFQDLSDRVKYVEVPSVVELHRRKSEYKALEAALGFFPR